MRLYKAWSFYCDQPRVYGVWTMFSAAAPYKNQQYHELKNDCIRASKLFEDPEFPATSSSLYFKKPPPGFVEWKRPRVSSTSIHPKSRSLKPCGGFSFFFFFLMWMFTLCGRRYARSRICLSKVSALMTWTRELWETAGLLLPAPVWLWSQTSGRRSVRVHLNKSSWDWPLIEQQPYFFYSYQKYWCV